MWSRTRRAAATAVLVCFGSSCSAMTPETRDQVLGGLMGAAVGAATGALAGRGSAQAIAAGAIAGAAVGWGAVKLTQYHAERTRSAQEEGQLLGYGGQGTVLNIRDASVSPQTVTPGGDVTFNVDYAVLAPKGTNTVPVEETWILEKDGKVLATTPSQTNPREPGGWQTRASLPLPKKATPGTYIVRNKISSGPVQQERITYFNVSATS